MVEPGGGKSALALSQCNLGCEGSARQYKTQEYLHSLNCLDLLDQRYNDFLKDAYSRLKDALSEQGKPLPSNRNMGKNDFDFKARELDCFVIRYACKLSEEAYGKPFDSVRAAFIEGSPIYEGAGFSSENHIQIAVINPNCIKGIFLPRQEIDINSSS